MNNLIKDAKNAAKEAREKALTFKRAEAVDYIRERFSAYFSYFRFLKFDERLNSYEIGVDDLPDFRLDYLLDTKQLSYWNGRNHIKITSLTDLGLAIEEHENK